MVKFQVILLVFCTLKVHAYSALNVYENVEVQNNTITPDILERSKIEAVGVTTDQIKKLSQLREDASQHEVCPIFSPDYKARANLTRSQILSIKSTVVVALKDSVILWKDVLCPYTSNPETYECFETSLGLRMDDYFQFQFINRTYITSSLQSRIDKALRLCVVLFGPYYMVNSESLKSLRKFSDVEWEQFVELWDQAQAISRISAYEHLCKFENVTSPPVEQANERTCS